MAHDFHSAFVNHRSQFAWQCVVFFVLSFTLLPAAADTANGSEPGCAGEPPASNEHPGPAPGEGLKVYVDPDTGELLNEPPPGAETLPPDLPAATQDLADIPVETRADGTIVADVGDRFVTELRVEMIDGQLVTCHRPAGQNQTLPSGPEIKQKGNDEP